MVITTSILQGRKLRHRETEANVKRYTQVPGFEPGQSGSRAQALAHSNSPLGKEHP